jgi:hypothetical protein
MKAVVTLAMLLSLILTAAAARNQPPSRPGSEPIPNNGVRLRGSNQLLARPGSEPIPNNRAKAMRGSNQPRAGPGSKAMRVPRAPFPYSLCSGAPTDLSISHVDVTPDPPQSGQNISIWAYGTVDEQLLDGSQLVVSVDFMGVQIFTETLPLSAVTSMPVGPGLIDINYAIVIPSGVPHGPYTVALTFNDQTDTEITCISISFDL